MSRERYIAARQRWAEKQLARGFKPRELAETGRLPPGQKLTAGGRTLMVQHDTANAQAYPGYFTLGMITSDILFTGAAAPPLRLTRAPRRGRRGSRKYPAYSRANVIKGTHGGFAGYPNRIFVEHGDGRGKHEWDLNIDPWYAKYDHPLWKKVADVGAELDRQGRRVMGHGGMDFVMRWRLVQCLRGGLPLDISVYDSAAWSAVGPLSEHSVANGGAPVAVPDFTRGGWRDTAPLGIVS